MGFWNILNVKKFRRSPQWFLFFCQFVLLQRHKTCALQKLLAANASAFLLVPGVRQQESTFSIIIFEISYGCNKTFQDLGKIGSASFPCNSRANNRQCDPGRLIDPQVSFTKIRDDPISRGRNGRKPIQLSPQEVEITNLRIGTIQLLYYFWTSDDLVWRSYRSSFQRNDTVHTSQRLSDRSLLPDGSFKFHEWRQGQSRESGRENGWNYDEHYFELQSWLWIVCWQENSSLRVYVR